jgi:hypothetical protein
LGRSCGPTRGEPMAMPWVDLDRVFPFLAFVYGYAVRILVLYFFCFLNGNTVGGCLHFVY